MYMWGTGLVSYGALDTNRFSKTIHHILYRGPTLWNAVISENKDLVFALDKKPEWLTNEVSCSNYFNNSALM